MKEEAAADGEKDPLKNSKLAMKLMKKLFEGRPDQTKKLAAECRAMGLGRRPSESLRLWKQMAGICSAACSEWEKGPPPVGKAKAGSAKK